MHVIQCGFWYVVYIISQRPFIIKSVCHILQWAGKGGQWGWRGVRLILLLFSQFIQSVSARSIHTDPWSLCVRPHMSDIDRKLQEAAQIAASSPLLLVAWHIQNKAVQNGHAGQVMNEQWQRSPSFHTLHNTVSMWMCCSAANTAAQAEGSCPKWFSNRWASLLKPKVWVPEQILFEDAPPPPCYSEIKLISSSSSKGMHTRSWIDLQFWEYEEY